MTEQADATHLGKWKVFCLVKLWVTHQTYIPIKYIFHSSLEDGWGEWIFFPYQECVRISSLQCCISLMQTGALPGHSSLFMLGLWPLTLSAGVWMASIERSQSKRSLVFRGGRQGRCCMWNPLGKVCHYQRKRSEQKGGSLTLPTQHTTLVSMAACCITKPSGT